MTIDEPGADGIGEIVVDDARAVHRLPAARPPAARPDPDRRPRAARRRRPPVRRRPSRRTGSCAAARTSRRPRSRPSCWPSPRSRTPRSSRAATTRLGQVPVAAIVLRAGADDPATTRSSPPAARRSPGSRCPAAIVRLDALPRTPGGKLRREAVRALRRRRAGRDPRPARRRRDRLARDRRRRDAAGPPARARSRPPASSTGSPRSSRGRATSPSTRSTGAAAARRVLADPRPLDVAVHVADLVAYLDARGHRARRSSSAISFGGVLALETAARHPDRVARPRRLGAALRPARRRGRRARGSATWPPTLADAHARGGPPAAAEPFMRARRRRRGVGSAARPRAGLPRRARATAALADAGLLGLDPDGLGRIAAPTTILDGSGERARSTRRSPTRSPRASRGARRATIEGLAPPRARSPTPARFADAVRAAVEPPVDRRPASHARMTTDRPRRRRDAVGRRHRAPATPPPTPRSGRCSTGSPRVYDPMNLADLRVPGAALAQARWSAAPGLRPGMRALDVASRHRQGRGRPPSARPARRPGPGRRHLARA